MKTPALGVRAVMVVLSSTSLMAAMTSGGAGQIRSEKSEYLRKQSRHLAFREWPATKETSNDTEAGDLIDQILRISPRELFGSASD